MMGTGNKETAYSRIMDFENSMARRRGRPRMERYRNSLVYYSGDNLPPDNIDQPLGINYIREINEKHTHYLFGQWEDDIINFRVEPIDSEDTDAKDLARQIEKWARKLLRDNQGNALLFECGLNASIFGDGFIRVTWDVINQQVRWENLLPEYCHARWDVNDQGLITEFIISYPIAREDALREYGTAGSSETLYSMTYNSVGTTALFWEHWTKLAYEIWVDDVMVEAKPNPYSQVSASLDLIPGIIPIVHIPNVRAGGEFYGYSDTDGIQLLQDELNRKLADEGDAINNFAHPITLLNGYYSDVEELPVGADQIWNLGKDGTAKYLTWEGAPPAFDKYIDRIMEIILDTSSMTSVAFGKHRGTQQSAIALAIEMLPVTEKSRWKRMIWEYAIRRMLKLSYLVGSRMGYTPGFTYQDLCDHNVKIQWAPILPRDRLAMINENVALVVNHLRSIETALDDIGAEDPDAEYDKIKSNVGDLIKLGLQLQGISMTGGASGNSALPEGVSDSSSKGKQ